MTASDPTPSSASPSPAPAAVPTAAEELEPFERMACSMRRRELRRIWAGYDPERSGELQIVPRRPHFIGKWLSHSGPWNYVQHVPLVFYGPGHVPEGVVVRRPVTTADIAPTLAAHLGFPFEAPDGQPIAETIEPDAAPPRLILVVIWDAVGRNVLDEHPDSWPTLRRVSREGAWMRRASVGSSPSVTPTIHTTLGTGAFPRHHGIVDLRFRTDGKLLPSRRVGPRLVRSPTLVELYDEAHANRPLVGLVASGGTFGMIGQGGHRPGGDPDLLIAEYHGEYSSQRNPELYAYADYVDEIPGPEVDARAVDLEDGRADGVWMGERVLGNRDDLAHTPAFSPYQTRVIEEVIRREGFGADDTPDMLFTNYKQTDNVSHRWSMNSRQMGAVLRASDAELGALIELLDRHVGEREWLLVLTADHGSTPNPETTGAFVIDNNELLADLRAAFDGDGDEREAIRDLRVTQIWLDLEELREHGHTVGDVATFVAQYTKAQNRQDPSLVAESERNDLLFEAAFPGAVLEDLPCIEERG